MITLFMFKMSEVQEDITSAADKLLPLSESLVHIEAYLFRNLRVCAERGLC